MPYLVYILKCADATLYTGITNNLERRVWKHNNSKEGAAYTRARRPVSVLYTEEFPTKGGAMKRELEIKKYTRADKLLLIQGKLQKEKLH